ncbi:hypothetical protein [Sphingobacterium mizutaii]|uniref:hypothetical protein n=1 Tax=Sphingobacterium mizutaii TaxID=1010 RepID=UPI001624DA5F|nr:hypothetical protein [Sphingobacterium mizutaii]
MNSFYIYSIFRQEVQAKSIVILFCPEETIDEITLKNELKKYFQNHILPDEFIVLGGAYLEADLTKYFIDNVKDTFLNINKVYQPDLLKSITVFSFDKAGQLKELTNKKGNKEKCSLYIQEGLINIFKTRGGLIEAHQGQHFVFPSGKHSEKFLRTGNILLYSPEIYFISFCLLNFFDFETHKYIFCDTSSINSLAMALVDLKKRFYEERKQNPLINSFKSYSIFEEEELVFGKKSLFLVSSSTSGGIIERFKEKKVDIPIENIVLLFFLGNKENFEKFERNIICNLTADNPNDITRIQPFPTYNIEKEKCQYCKKGSMALNVIGDTFLSEKPRINKVLLKVFHAPKNLSPFVEQFICKGKTENNIIKCNFKENPNPEDQYDIYIDMDMIYDSISRKNKRYSPYNKILRKKINLNIPSNTKYIITLDDSGSKKLAKLILTEFKKTHKILPKIVEQNEINKKLKNEEGSVVIACSSVVNGGNLLYISKALRAFDELSIVYLIGLVRTRDEKYHDFLVSNLSQGSTLGNSNSPFVPIERLHFPEKHTNTIWLNEKVFLDKLILFLYEDLDSSSPKYNKEVLSFFENRLKLLKSVDNNNKGISNGLFYPNIYDNNKELILNKNFAFLNFEQYYENISQSEVYFIISTILNNLRNNIIKGDTLIQKEHDRNVLDPGNFLRFNDGIIQSCLLRASLNCELDYSLDENLSSQMKDVILDIIKNEDIIMREPIMEFAYAISSKKIKLLPEHHQIIKNELQKLNHKLINILFENFE